MTTAKRDFHTLTCYTGHTSKQPNIATVLLLSVCALYNFIHQYDPDDFLDPKLSELDLQANGGLEDEEHIRILGDGPADAAERQRADVHHDTIVQDMWVDYQCELGRCGLQWTWTFLCTFKIHNHTFVNTMNSS